ncbi:5'-nucleotidase C-terminal domain-containing protein [Roseobacter sp.]|uniref:5'-nucleotidase C-terminal domain-containing protein n=1 Tax=Roseobacter sp. TaxID=1907202 RepID=UPI0025F30FA6|nr:5'-nucleotidase C-terminal domain-containing protein [Roseobacter sp.]
MTLLATSDLHMQITSYDYVRDCAGEGPSLSRLATLIASARQEAAGAGRESFLLDNGDILQGTPLAAYLAHSGRGTPNPVPECLQMLGYDAVGLGNHDFDHGLEYLDATLSRYRMPVVCSNLGGAGIPSIRPRAILEREVLCSDGTRRRLRIGVVSVLPRQTISWNRHQLSGRASLCDPVQATADAAKAARAEGADLIVVLAHMGIARFDEGVQPQNEIVEIARLGSVDAVIGGHTHLVFPGPDHETNRNTDSRQGKVYGKPVVLPGFAGSHLGLIDLDLAWPANGGSIRITRSESRLAKSATDTPEDPDVAALASEAHLATREHLNHEVGRLMRPMNSYFALAQPSPVSALIAETKRHVIRQAMAGSDLEELPLLASGSTASTGGFDGPDNFISLPGGPVKRRHIVGLDPYSNQVWAVRTTGARLTDWLERSVVIFNTLRREDPDQLLLNENIPGFRYDAIYGLNYDIDPTRPPKYDPAGRPGGTGEGRISNVTWKGRPLEPEQEFLVATSDHRTGGGGQLRAFSEDEIAFRGRAPLEDGLVSYLQAPDCAAVRGAAPWRFRPDLNVSAILLTSPDAVTHLSEIADLRPEPCGISENGFARIRLHL